MKSTDSAANSFIIHRGDVAKFQLSISHEDFDQMYDDFYAVIHYGMFGNSIRIDKCEMTCDEDGSWFVFFDTSSMVGMLKAETHYMVHDTDIDGMLRDVTDFQHIGFVTEDPCLHFGCRHSCHNSCDAHVKWKRVFRSDTNTVYLKLRTSEHEPILDSDGEQLRVRKHNMN